MPMYGNSKQFTHVKIVCTTSSDISGPLHGCATTSLSSSQVHSHAGLDFAYPEAAKIGGLVSGPSQQGAGTAESPSGWVIAVERCVPKPQGELPEQPSTSGREDAAGTPQGEPKTPCEAMFCLSSQL